MTYFAFKMLWLLFLITSVVACAQPIYTPLSLRDTLLLYVEDIDGRDGFGDGNFSDLVVHDLTTGQTHALTDDGNFYASPTLISRRYLDPWQPASSRTDTLDALVLFAGKVGPEVQRGGLGVTTRLYTLDPSHGSIRPWNPPMIDVDSLEWHEPLSAPKACRGGEKVAFGRGTELVDLRPYVYDAQLKMSRPIKGGTFGTNFSWSEDCKQLAFGGRLTGSNAIKIFLVDANSLTITNTYEAPDTSVVTLDPILTPNGLLYSTWKDFGSFREGEQVIRGVDFGTGKDSVIAMMPTTKDFYRNTVYHPDYGLYYLFFRDGHANAGYVEVRTLDFETGAHADMGLGTHKKGDLSLHVGW